MYGKEEWGLVQLCPQCKSVEWPVWLVFPDYICVSCEYDITLYIMLRGNFL